MLYAFFWAIPRLLNFICRRFGTLCLFHLHRQVGVKMEQSVPKRRHIKFSRRGITQKKAYNIVCGIVCLMSLQALEMVRFLRWAGCYGHRIGESLAVRSCCIMQCDKRLSVTGTSSYYITTLVSGNSQCTCYWFRRVTPSDTWIYGLTLDSKTFTSE